MCVCVRVYVRVHPFTQSDQKCIENKKADLKVSDDVTTAS